MSKKRISKIIGLVFVGIFFISSSTAYAAITASPVRIEIVLPAGETQDGTYTVFNNSENKQTVKVKVEDWPRNIDKPETQRASNWLKIDPQEFSVEPGGKKEIKFIAEAPKDGKGENIAMVFFEGIEEGIVSGIKTRYGVVMYVAISGTENVEGKIEDIDISLMTGKDTEPGLIVKTTIKNEGNVHIRPKGKVAIKDSRNREIATSEITTNLGLLPGYQFDYKAVFSDLKLKKGKYKAVSTINFGEMFRQPKELTHKKSFRVDKTGEIQN